MEDDHTGIQVEGYLHKRQAGIVKTLKRKWYVLKDGELRCYHSKESWTKNADMYQDTLPVSNIQTVRCASENLGVEVVTQQRVSILVAPSEEDQQKWIKAIYETMKENGPRSVSCPSDKTSPTRKTSSGSRFGFTRILSDIRFNRKSLDETQGGSQSQFLDSPKSAQEPSYSEMGVQADVKIPTSETLRDDEKLGDGVFDTSGTRGSSTNVMTEKLSDNGHSTTESSQFTESGHCDSHCVDSGPIANNSLTLNGQVESNETSLPVSCPEDEQIVDDETLIKQGNDTHTEEENARLDSTETGHVREPCFDTEAPSNSSEIPGDSIDALVKSIDALAKHVSLLEQEDDDGNDETAREPKEENAMHELYELLQSEAEEKKDGDCDGVFQSDDDDSISLGSSEENDTLEGKSAFEQLQELLKG